MKMTNKKYLEQMREARNKWISDYNLDCDKIIADEVCDKVRIAMALEIIAGTLIDINDSLNRR